MAITDVEAVQILDSRGNPSLEVSVYTEKGLSRAAVPSGASTGSHEAHELRDGGKALSGKGVHKAVANVNDVLGPALIKSGIDIKDQAAVDKLLCELDGTPNKSKLGANAILGVSLAVAKAAAAEKGIPLYAHIQALCRSKMPYVTPIPFMNVLNGGAHAPGRLPFQEFMIAPTGFSSFSEALWAGDEVYVALGKVAKKKYGRVFIGDEGGFAPAIQTAEEALDMIVEAIEIAGYTGKVKIAMDCASSEFYQKDSQKYDLDYKNENGSDPSKWITPGQLGDLYNSWFKKYPFVSIEDPFAEDDWEAWSTFSKDCQEVQVVGDDLTVTNPIFIKKAIELKACNALLLKVNQIGTLTESLQAAKDAQDAGWNVMVSHRSGETEDVTIADLSVGLRAGQIKSGAPARTDRVAKYNQLIRIEKELLKQYGEKGVVYAGEHFRSVSKI